MWTKALHEVPYTPRNVKARKGGPGPQSFPFRSDPLEPNVPLGTTRAPQYVAGWIVYRVNRTVFQFLIDASTSSTVHPLNARHTSEANIYCRSLHQSSRAVYADADNQMPEDRTTSNEGLNLKFRYWTKMYTISSKYVTRNVGPQINTSSWMTGLHPIFDSAGLVIDCSCPVSCFVPERRTNVDILLKSQTMSSSHEAFLREKAQCFSLTRCWPPALPSPFIWRRPCCAAEKENFQVFWARQHF